MLDKTWDYHNIWLLESIQLHWWWEIYPSHSESRPHFKDPETGAHTNTIERTWCAVKDSLPKSGTQKYIYQSYFLEYILRKRYFAECGNKFGVFIDWIRRGYLLRPWPRSEAVPRPLNSLCRDQCGDSAGSIHPESRPAEQQALCLEHNSSLNEFHLQGRLYILILVLCFHACYGDVFRWPVFVGACFDMWIWIFMRSRSNLTHEINEFATSRFPHARHRPGKWRSFFDEAVDKPVRNRINCWIQLC